MTPPSMADAVAVVENACRSARSAPGKEPERRHRADEPAAVVREVAAALETAFRSHRLAVPDQTPYGIVAVTGHAGPGVPRAAFATVDAVAPFEAESSWTGVLADAYPDVGWLLLVCADFGRMRGPRAGAAYSELLAGAGALAHALRLAVSCPRRDARIHTGSHRPVTSAVRRRHPGMRHLVTVSAGPLDGSPT